MFFIRAESRADVQEDFLLLMIRDQISLLVYDKKKKNWKESQRKKASKPVYLIIYSNVYVCVFTCEPIHSTSVNGTRDFSNAACSVHSFYVALP